MVYDRDDSEPVPTPSPALPGVDPLNQDEYVSLILLASLELTPTAGAMFGVDELIRETRVYMGSDFKFSREEFKIVLGSKDVLGESGFLNRVGEKFCMR